MRLQVLLQLQQAVQTFGRCVAGSMPLQYREIRSRSWLSTPTHAVNAEGEYSQRLYCTNTQQLPAAQISVLSLTLLLLRELTPLFIRNRVCTAQGAAPCYTSTFSGHFYNRSILPPRSPSPARLVRALRLRQPTRGRVPLWPLAKAFRSPLPSPCGKIGARRREESRSSHEPFAAAHAADGSAGALWDLLVCDSHREQPPPHALTAHLPLARLLNTLERDRR